MPAVRFVSEHLGLFANDGYAIDHTSGLDPGCTARAGGMGGSSPNFRRSGSRRAMESP